MNKQNSTLEVKTDFLPQGAKSLPSAPAMGVSATAVASAQSKAVQEIQAAIFLARQFPRDEEYSLQRILRQCENKLFAESAMYAYPKGGTTVTGASIRLAETAARNWGNLNFGWEMTQETNEGAHVRAFCWDMETNVANDIKFYVKFERKAKGAIYKIHDPRERYEHVANMATRRLRACVMRTIPGFVFEQACEVCQRVLKKEGIDINKLIDAFKELGVSKEMIEARIGHKANTLSPHEAVQLRTIYASIRDGFKPVNEYFNVEENAGTDAPKPPVSFKKKKKAKKIEDADKGIEDADNASPPSPKNKEDLDIENESFFTDKLR